MRMEDYDSSESSSSSSSSELDWRTSRAVSDLMHSLKISSPPSGGGRGRRRQNRNKSHMQLNIDSGRLNNRRSSNRNQIERNPGPSRTQKRSTKHVFSNNVSHKRTSALNKLNEVEQHPPEDFREIEVMPTAEELTAKQRPYIRANIIKGAYENVDHYLDVQFRLMREDFICPLREGIFKYLANPNATEFDNLRVYKKVRLGTISKLWNGQTAIVVIFDEKLVKNKSQKEKSEKKKILANNKRFMFGALVCFTNDNFKTMFNATVNDARDADEGLVTVALDESVSIQGLTNSYYLMVESEVFFLPYYHVLKALQNFDPEDVFPMERYIVHVQSKTNPPVYLNKNRQYRICNGNTVAVFNDLSWPSADKVGLNESQYKAYKMALTREFVTIQGPPGTGKTFVGLKIAKTLIENNVHGTPILVVCYTNQALDQFLVGLLDVTKKIVRIGGQSKNETLKEYNLQALRKQQKEQNKEQHRNHMQHKKKNGKRFSIDEEITMNANVIGITTTGAARLQSLLSSLEIRIVIVEEAAEVMESHIIVSLSSSCEHVIMIGDHQQLRPSAATYYLTRHFNLDISLFERMVKNGNHCYQLEVQHRMRPEIAALISPSIYPNLQNAPNVKVLPTIKGVLKSLAFITHEAPERKEENGSSHFNPHEAKFLLCLAKYLIQQDYKPEDITILVAYSGQMVYLKEERRKHEILSDVLITVLDGYQGEENKIILLSLVRSNATNRIGFLSNENRVCVALSRAKEGLYIIGNMRNMKHKSDLWKEVNQSLVNQNAIGDSLTLQCRFHQNKFTLVRNETDFNQVREGGCNKNCNALLVCGHKCRYMCHPKDREHENLLCTAPCDRTTCINGHKCPDPCYKECRPCNVSVTLHLPCSHRVVLKCHKTNNYSCTAPCLRKVCINGHKCPDPCYKKCRPCNVKVVRNLACSHEAVLACHADPDEYNCMKMVEVVLELCKHKIKKPCHVKNDDVDCPTKCLQQLSCGHVCDKLCHERRDPGHLNDKCNQICNSILECGHNCRYMCHLENREHKNYMCLAPCIRKICANGHKCPDICCKECRPCSSLVYRDLPCYHKAVLGCRIDPNKYNCTQMVYVAMETCNHLVRKQCQYRNDMICTEICNQQLSCGHVCTLVCHMNRNPEHVCEKCQRCWSCILM